MGGEEQAAAAEVVVHREDTGLLGNPMGSLLSKVQILMEKYCLQQQNRIRNI